MVPVTTEVTWEIVSSVAASKISFYRAEIKVFVDGSTQGTGMGIRLLLQLFVVCADPERGWVTS